MKLKSKDLVGEYNWRRSLKEGDNVLIQSHFHFIDFSYENTLHFARVTNNDSSSITVHIDDNDMTCVFSIKTAKETFVSSYTSIYKSLICEPTPSRVEGMKNKLLQEKIAEEMRQVFPVRDLSSKELKIVMYSVIALRKLMDPSYSESHDMIQHSSHLFRKSESK